MSTVTSRVIRHRAPLALLSIVALVGVTLPGIVAAAPAAAATTPNWSNLQSILTRSTSTMTTPPTATPSSNIPDGGLMGNGHMTGAVGGAATAQTYYLGATDFWQDAVPKTIGGVTVNIPSLSGASYQQQQDILNAEVRSTFSTSTATITERSWISANEDLMVLTLSSASTSTASSAVSVATFAGAQDSLPTTSGLTSSNTMWATRTTNSSTWLANAALASRVLVGPSVTYSTNSSTSATASFTLSPGQTVQIATVLGDSGGNVSGSPWPAPSSLSTVLGNAQTRVGQLNATAGNSNSVLDADALHSAHLNWWKTFWLAGADIDLGGGSAERFWYTSLYAMAVSNRSGRTAPGMPNFLTNDNPVWSGFWATDYNFEMPYQGLYAANHIELTQPYERGVIDCVPAAKNYATAAGYQGVLYGSIIDVGGQCAADTLSMKGDAAWLSTNFVSHWNYTHDATWASNTGYPYLVQVANFWDNYLTKSNGVYNISGSAQNEGSNYQQNPIGDLAWLRSLYPALLQMSQVLGVDSSRRALWQDIAANLAPYPTFTTGGHTDYKATQDSSGFYGGDANPADAVFPGNTIDLGSSVSSIVTAQNTVNDVNVWCQENSFAWIFPAAARVGLPSTYSRLNTYLNGGCYGGLRGNSTVVQDGGGAETFGGMETVSSMLLSSASGTIHLFPDWPQGRNASFTNMLASGAFAVTSSLASGVVGATTITSNSGLTATVASPWAPGTIAVTDSTTGAAVSLTSAPGNVVSFPTTAGHDYRLTGTGSFDFSRLDLAQVGPATASSSHTGGGWSTANVNDGVRTSTSASLGWSSGDSGTGSNHTEWAQVDLGSPQVVGDVDLYPRTDSGNVGQGFPVNFTISGSTDGSTWTTLVTKTGAALPTGVQSYPFANASVRYLRVTGTSLRANPNDGGQYRMQFAEIEAYAPTNLARAATTSSSSSYEGFQWSVNNVNDGDYGTGWSSNSSSGSSHTEWLQEDLGSSRPVGEVDLYPRTDPGNLGQGFPIDFTIAVSNDATNWTTVVTKTGYAMPTTANGELFPFATQSARYVRVTGTTLRSNSGDYRMQFSEMQAYAPSSLGWTATPTASSSHEGGPWSINYVNDNNTATGWSSGDAATGSSHTEWVQLDQGAAIPISEVDLYPRTDSGNVGQGFPVDFTIALSTDGTNWTTAVTKTGYAMPSSVQSFGFTTGTARYVRITGTTLRTNPNDGGSYRMQFSEVATR